MRMLRSTVLFAALAFAAPALAQTNPGTSPLSGAKGGTNNAFMQFAGPASAVKTFTLPNASGTIGVLNAIATWTAAQSFSDGTVVLLGSSSGSSTLKAPATGGGTATLFPGSDTIVGRASTDTLTNKTISGASNTLTVRLGSDVTGTLPIANNCPGSTGASSSTFLRGDCTWQTPAGGGNVSNTGTPVANQIAQWISATVVQGINLASLLSSPYGITVGGTTSPTLAVSLSTLSNVLAGDVTMNSANTFFAGPTVAQGTTGTWFASGSVVIVDSAANVATCKLHDGTTIIASTQIRENGGGTGGGNAIALSGQIASPAGNIRIDCETNVTTATMKASLSGLAKDSIVSVHRIQ